MADIFTLENLANLGAPIFLQAAPGIVKLLCIAPESKRAPAAHRAAVRRWGVLLAPERGAAAVEIA